MYVETMQIYASFTVKIHLNKHSIETDASEESSSFENLFHIHSLWTASLMLQYVVIVIKKKITLLEETREQSTNCFFLWAHWKEIMSDKLFLISQNSKLLVSEVFFRLSRHMQCLHTQSHLPRTAGNSHADFSFLISFSCMIKEPSRIKGQTPDKAVKAFNQHITEIFHLYSNSMLCLNI